MNPDAVTGPMPVSDPFLDLLLDRAFGNPSTTTGVDPAKRK